MFSLLGKYMCLHLQVHNVCAPTLTKTCKQSWVMCTCALFVFQIPSENRVNFGTLAIVRTVHVVLSRAYRPP